MLLKGVTEHERREDCQLILPAPQYCSDARHLYTKIQSTKGAFSNSMLVAGLNTDERR